jgi:hypothetical protein
VENNLFVGGMLQQIEMNGWNDYSRLIDRISDYEALRKAVIRRTERQEGYRSHFINGLTIRRKP